jgi:hypothetical protein
LRFYGHASVSRRDADALVSEGPLRRAEQAPALRQRALADLSAEALGLI